MPRNRIRWSQNKNHEYQVQIGDIVYLVTDASLGGYWVNIFSINNLKPMGFMDEFITLSPRIYYFPAPIHDNIDKEEERLKIIRKENAELKHKLNPHNLCDCGWFPEIKIEENPVGGIYNIGGWTFSVQENPQICPKCFKFRWIAFN